MIQRLHTVKQIKASFRVHPAVALTGPRQCGKTTLARMIEAVEDTCTFFDLEKAVDRRRLETPEQTLSSLQGLIVLDEIQRMPEIYETLRVLMDRPGNPARFLLLGSASPELIRGISESLAGRIGFVDVGGFNVRETGTITLRKLWLRGGFPRSFLAANDADSVSWRESFIRTFLERDIPQLGIRVPSETLRRFWTMIAHYHGQVWNAAEFARALGANEITARRYLDILAGAFMVRILPPWFENLKKRQVKAPKIYVRDTGLLHSLLGFVSEQDLTGHPKLGASWEGFVIEQLLSILDTRSATFWGTHGGAELDILVTIHGRRYGFECKYADAPGSTKSMRQALSDLSLEHLWVVYPGKESYALDERLSVLAATEIPGLIQQLF